MWRCVLLALCGCNSLLDIHDLPPLTDDPCVGECECRIDDDCPLTTYCNDQGTSRTCDCVAGYAESGDGCAWAGVLPDEPFADAAAWTLVAPSEFVVDQTTLGPALMSAMPEGRATTTITLPRASRTPPLVLEVVFAALKDGGYPLSADVGPAFGIAGRWTEGPTGRVESAMQSTARFCLGADQYAPPASTGAGSEVAFALSANRDGGKAEDEGLAFLDAAIVPANPDECAPIGTILNGDAEADEIWVFTPGTGGTANYTLAQGENGSRGLYLAARQRCSGSRVGNGRISIPNSVSPALQFYTFTKDGINALAIGSRQQHVFAGGTATAVTRTLCLESPLRGTAQSIDHSVTQPTGTCGEAVDVIAILDSFRIVEEPSCGTDPEVTDPGFESMYSTISPAVVSGRGTARHVRDDPSLAHSGAGVVELVETKTCSSASFRKAVVIAPSDSGGPAIAFWYRGNGSFTVAGSSFTGDDQWLRGVACLPPRLADRGVTVTWQLASAATCDTATNRTIYIDDLEAISDPGCPR